MACLRRRNAALDLTVQRFRTHPRFRSGWGTAEPSWPVQGNVKTSSPMSSPFRRALASAVAVLSLGACASSGGSRVPSDYLQLRFAPVGKPVASATITVGTKVAVLALSGHQDPPGYPISQDPSVVKPIQWVRPAPHGWYPFQALTFGRAVIWEGYPCSGAGCSAGRAEIVLTVVPASA